MMKKLILELGKGRAVLSELRRNFKLHMIFIIQK